MLFRSGHQTESLVEFAGVGPAGGEAIARLYMREVLSYKAGPMSQMAASEAISVTVNGEWRCVGAGATIAAMLAELGVDPRRVAVERNLEIVPRSILAEVEVAEGDRFEIVHFVGGG